MSLPKRNFTTQLRLGVLLLFLFSTCSASIPNGPRTPSGFSLGPAAPAEARIFIPYVSNIHYRFRYTASDADILNPERGFRSYANLLKGSDFTHFREIDGNTLVHAYVRLDSYRASDLPADLLANLDAALGRLRTAGVKVVLRFSYNFGPYPDSEPDASKAWVLRHIAQLTPTLQKNADVIAWLQAGFIGAWGEWHTSTNGLDNPTDKRDILNALLAAMPADRMVQLRYPMDIQALYPNPLTPEQAFTGSPQARIGHHNDCFLASDTDSGTYRRSNIPAGKAYVSQIGRFTPIGVETCEPNPPRSECATALQEMAELHITEVNNAYHEQVIDGWKSGGCYEEMRRRLGYRLTLRSADFEPVRTPGSMLNLYALLENSGFAAPVNPRALLAVLDGPARYVFPLSVDPRRWEPGMSAFSAQIQLPANIAAGTYHLSLWLPDPSPALQQDPRYAIRFANANMWEEKTGYNVLGAVTVQK